MGPNFRFSKKVFQTTFFTHKTCFTTFHIDYSQKIKENFLGPIFQKNFISYCPPMGPKFHFSKKVFPTFFFHLQNMFQTSSHLLETKTTNFCEIQFFSEKK